MAGTSLVIDIDPKSRIPNPKFQKQLMQCKATHCLQCKATQPCGVAGTSLVIDIYLNPKS